MRKTLEVLFSLLEVLGIGVLLGALVTLGIAVAGTVFQNAGSITLAGELNGRIISRIHAIELACMVVLVASLLYFFLTKEIRSSPILYTKMIFGLIIIGPALYFVFPLMTEMEYLRLNVIVDFDNNQSSLIEERAYYRELHQRYTTLVSIVALSSIGYAVMVAIEKAKLVFHIGTSRQP